jgi:transglutaminase-like putative cysteine protease
VRLSIDHVTRYRYAEPANGIIQLLRLTPREADSQHVIKWRIDVDADGRLTPFTDAHGNSCHIFYADRPVETLTLHVAGAVQTAETAGIVSGTQDPLPPLTYLRSTPLTEASPAIAQFAENLRDADALAQAHALMHAVREKMGFEPGVTDVVTDAASAFRQGSGVCQDLAQIMISAARHLGTPARYVSGHFAAPDHPEQEAAHAWAELHIPHLGWVAFDPTHGVGSTEGHVRVAVGLDSLEASPVRGTRRGGGAESLAVVVHGREYAARQPQQQQSQS